MTLQLLVAVIKHQKTLCDAANKIASVSRHVVECGGNNGGIFKCWNDAVLSQEVTRVPFPRHMKHRELFIRGGIVIHRSSRAGPAFR